MTSVTVQSIGKMMHLVTSDQHALVADEPPEEGT